MSGTGKSSVIAGVAELGYAAVDLDEPAWSIYDETGDWIWREERVRRLLDERLRTRTSSPTCSVPAAGVRTRS